MFGQARAILWAQIRIMRNYYPRKGLLGLVFSILVAVLWYGLWTVGALGAAILISDPANERLTARLVPAGMFLAFLYWQVIPILMVSAGVSLDLKKLLVYPVPHSQLFAIEVLLRVTVGAEVLLVLCGTAVGLLLNPQMPAWTPLPLIPFALLNMCLSAGVRDLLGRLLGRKRVREVVIFVLVLMAALPQVLFLTGVPESVRRFFERSPTALFPWAASARIALGQSNALNWTVLLAWTLAAYFFGRWQFERGLRFDADAARATEIGPTPRGRWQDRLYMWPRWLFRDPLAAIIEKEIRFLSRAPRFRLVFLMGFSFGLLVWLPMAFGGGQSSLSIVAGNYLTFVSVYALMLLGEVSFWNTFGFDRAAAQIYFLVPVRTSTVLLGKNIAALFFVLAEITLVAIVCGALRMPMTVEKLVEAYAVTLVLTLYMMGVGNLSSTYQPRGVNPTHSWRSSGAGRFQILLLVVYPVLASPILLAYLARYAFDSSVAFYVVLSFAAAVGGVVYWVAMGSAIETAESNKERMLASLAQGYGPVSG